jgi:hypothetical protein
MIKIQAIKEYQAKEARDCERLKELHFALHTVENSTYRQKFKFGKFARIKD